MKNDYYDELFENFIKKLTSFCASFLMSGKCISDNGKIMNLHIALRELIEKSHQMFFKVVPFEEFFIDLSPLSRSITLNILSCIGDSIAYNGIIKIYQKHATPKEQIQIIDAFIRNDNYKYQYFSKLLVTNCTSNEAIAYMRKYMESQDDFINVLYRDAAGIDLKAIRTICTVEQATHIIKLQFGPALHSVSC